MFTELVVSADAFPLDEDLRGLIDSVFLFVGFVRFLGFDVVVGDFVAVPFQKIIGFDPRTGRCASG